MLDKCGPNLTEVDINLAANVFWKIDKIFKFSNLAFYFK